MELVPRALVVGLFAPPVFPGQQPVTVDQINKIWSEVAPGRYGQLQQAPDGTAAQFLGSTPDTGMTIQHPLIQVRDVVKLTPEKTAEELQQLLKSVARNLGLTQVFNLGIKLVCHAAVPSNDAKGFILNHVLSQEGANVEELLPPGGDVFAGFKVVATHPSGTYTLTAEPLLADQMRSLFLDLDAQFPGPTTVDAVQSKADEVRHYMNGNVSRYLDQWLST